MAHTTHSIREIVDAAVNHTWSIPEFQRGFVWKATQVRDLAESLWLEYPIGTLLVWNSDGQAQEKSASDGQTPNLWVVDGQQRATALAILFGRKPYWWPDAEEWDRKLRSYDIRFDVDSKEGPYFVTASAAIRAVKEPRYIPLRDLLVLDTNKSGDQQKLQELAKRVKQSDLCHGMDAMEVYTRLDRVRKIRDKTVVTISIDQELEDVVEIFSRLNGRGTRVTEADIYLGVVAARTPGWVKSTFLPFRDKLADAGIDASPNLVFRSLTAVGEKKVRFKQIGGDFWNSGKIQPAWKRTEKAWRQLVKRFREVGILSTTLLPTENALVPLVTLLDKYPDADFDRVLFWFLQASRFARYSGSVTTRLDEDLKDIDESLTLDDALHRLTRRFPGEQPLAIDDFLKDYGDGRFGRLLLYLQVYARGARDWDEKGLRLGFDGTELLEDFKPQWHHVFPKKYLEGKVPHETVDALANIAVIGPSINIRISAQKPMDYIERYGIEQERLDEQFIDEDVSSIGAEGYVQWVTHRAEVLVAASNDYLAVLKGNL